MENLPNEMILEVFRWLSLNSLRKMPILNSRFLALCQDSRVQCRLECWNAIPPTDVFFSLSIQDRQHIVERAIPIGSFAMEIREETVDLLIVKRIEDDTVFFREVAKDVNTKLPMLSPKLPTEEFGPEIKGVLRYNKRNKNSPFFLWNRKGYTSIRPCQTPVYIFDHFNLIFTSCSIYGDGPK